MKRKSQSVRKSRQKYNVKWDEANENWIDTTNTFTKVWNVLGKYISSKSPLITPSLTTADVTVSCSCCLYNKKCYLYHCTDTYKTCWGNLSEGMLCPYLSAWARDRRHLSNTKSTDCNNSLSPTAHSQWDPDNRPKLSASPSRQETKPQT